MKIKKLLFLSVFLIIALLFVPMVVNAENSKGYNVKVKNLEDYVCEEMKGHSLRISMQAYNKIVVYDETTDKEHLIDFSKKGVCEEYTGEKFYDNYVPTEYSWDGNNLYLETYSSNYLFVNAKTLDKEIEPNSSYAELKQDGFYHVDNPTDENLSNYYEVYYFELATGEYDKNASYYEIKQYQFSTDNYNGDYELATSVELEENTYEANKYYVIAKPVKKELIAQFDTDKFIVSKDKSGLESDLTLSRFDFIYYFEFGNKTYYVFTNLEQQNRYCAIFDEKGNYQTFGLDNLLTINIFSTDDNKYLSFLAKVDNKNHIILLDEKLNIIVLHDVSEYGDDISLIGYNENEFYYSVYHNEDKILEINYFGSADKYTVTFDANGGKFGNETIYTIDNWNANLYDSLIEPTRDGYTFKGYYTEKTGGTKFEMILNESGIDSDMTFYAQWEENSGEVPPTTGEESQPDNNNSGNTDTGNTNTGDINTGANNNNNNTSTGNNPQTSDNILFFVEMLLIAVIGITVTTKFRKIL